jgi:hypothetical protein
VTTVPTADSATALGTLQNDVGGALVDAAVTESTELVEGTPCPVV